MKWLLDNNLPIGICFALESKTCASVRTELTASATDKSIFEFCIKRDIDVFITKDKQFAWTIAESKSDLKCILCTFGNMSIAETINIFKENKEDINKFVKSNLKILEI